MDPSTAGVYLIGAAGFGWGAHLLSRAARQSRLAVVAGAIAVVIASVLVGLLSGPAGLLGWMTVVVGLSEWRRPRPEGDADRDSVLGPAVPRASECVPVPAIRPRRRPQQIARRSPPAPPARAHRPSVGRDVAWLRHPPASGGTDQRTLRTVGRRVTRKPTTKATGTPMTATRRPFISGAQPTVRKTMDRATRTIGWNT